MILTNPDKESLNSQKQKKLPNNMHNVVQDEKEVAVLIGEPVNNSVPKIQNTCYLHCIKSEGSVFSKYSFFSIASYISYMSIISYCSICGVVCVNCAFSILSVNSVASVASVNSVLSIGSVNCYECVFNIPFQALSATDHTSSTCEKYSLVDGDQDHFELNGLTYEIYHPKITHLSEEDLVDECCFFLRSLEAKQLKMKGFILDAKRTGCLVYSNESNGGNDKSTLDQDDVSKAKFTYTSRPLAIK